MKDALVYALGVAISPVAIGSVVLILSRAHPLPSAASFAAGWIVGVALVASLFAAAVQIAGISDSRPAWIAVLELVVGAAFLAAAARLSLGRRARGGTSPLLEVVDRVPATRSAALGLFLSGANPKVFALALGSALTLADAGASLTLATVVLFTAVGALGVLVPIAVYAAYPAQGAARMRSLRRWLGRRERGVLIVLALAIAAVFIRDGIRVLGA